VTLGLGEQLHRRFIAMDALAGEDVGADQIHQRLNHSRAGTDVVGQSRER
jgi:hypothetical protein